MALRLAGPQHRLGQRWLEVRRTVYVHCKTPFLPFFPRAKCEHTSLRGLFKFEIAAVRLLTLGGPREMERFCVLGRVAEVNSGFPRSFWEICC